MAKTAYTARKLIAIAEAEVGYLEKKSNSQLDDKTANAGDKNWTKYARDLRAAGYYNGNKNGYAWCDVFVDWLFYQLCDKDADKAQKIICQTGLYGAGCSWSAKYYRNAGRFYDSPQVGDQIFFGTSGDETHTGVVYKVDGSKVYTIEGNTSGASGVIANGGGVCKKSYALGYSKISGYGRPLYDAEEAAATEPEEQPGDTEANKFRAMMDTYMKTLRDNDASAWSGEARNWAIENGLVMGIGELPDGEINYAWEAPLTREQMVTLLYRFYQLVEEK